jgi:hypothetical protein
MIAYSSVIWKVMVAVIVPGDREAVERRLFDTRRGLSSE